MAKAAHQSFIFISSLLTILTILTNCALHNGHIIDNFLPVPPFNALQQLYKQHFSIIKIYIMNSGSEDIMHISNRKLRNNVTLAIIIIVWYFGALASVTTTKMLMNEARLPSLLCCSQFFFASIFSYGYLQFNRSFRPLHFSIVNIIYQITATYTIGFVLTNSAFSIGMI